MVKKIVGPYEHYERPSTPRQNQYEDSHSWLHWLTIITVSLVTLLPAAHYASTLYGPKSSSQVVTTKTVKPVKRQVVVKAARPTATKTSSASAVASAKRSKVKSYVVQDGDTLSSIAARFHTTIAKLVTLNQLTDNSIQAGQTIVVK